MRMRRRNHGFSLIEILVVIVIVGTVMTVFILSLGLLGGQKDLRDEAQRLISLLQLAQDESMMQGREFGLEFMNRAYRFVEFDPLTAQWNEIIGDDTLRLRTLPEELELFLFIEDRRVLLQQDPAAIRTEEEKRRNPRVEAYSPHVLIYSSGDMTPFELHVVREADEQLVMIRNDLGGEFEFIDELDRMQ